MEPEENATGYIKPVHILTSHFLETHFNIISHPHLDLTHGLLPFRVLAKILYAFFVIFVLVTMAQDILNNIELKFIATNLRRK
jgi:hypothetical protein